MGEAYPIIVWNWHSSLGTSLKHPSLLGSAVQTSLTISLTYNTRHLSLIKTTLGETRSSNVALTTGISDFRWCVPHGPWRCSGLTCDLMTPSFTPGREMRRVERR